MTNKHKTKFKALVTALNDLITDIRLIHPDAQFYLENGHNFFILSGRSHNDDYRNTARHDRILDHQNLMHSDCGGW